MGVLPDGGTPFKGGAASSTIVLDTADHAGLVLAYGEWLLNVVEIDPFDFGHKLPNMPKPKYRTTTKRLNAGYGRPPAHIESSLGAMLAGRVKLYCKPRHGAWLVMPTLDIDAHGGETDAAALAAWVIARYFPGAYDEPSGRGHHGHPLIDVGNLSPAKFNELLKSAQESLRALAGQAGFKSVPEFKGNFALRDRRGRIIEGKRGNLGAVPKLPNGLADLDRLGNSPVRPVSALRAIVRDAKPLLAAKAAPPVTTPHPRKRVSLPNSVLVNSGDPDRFRLKGSLCREMAQCLGRVPTVGELDIAYTRLAGPETSDPAERARQLRNAVRFCQRTFDPEKMARSGYAVNSTRLESVVADCCTPEVRAGRLGKNAANKLAVMLYVVESNCHEPHKDPDYQDGAGYNAFRGMARMLRAVGAYDGPILNDNDVSAGKVVLQDAGLIACADGEYRKGGRGKKGVSMKYVLGPAHPRYLEFQQFRQDQGIRTRTLAEIEVIEDGRKNRATAVA